MRLRQSRIFNVSLQSTASVDAASGAINNLRYTINWDSIFNGENAKYQTARLRVDLISDNVASATNIGNTTGILVLQGLTTLGGSCAAQGTGKPTYNNGGAYCCHIYPTSSSAVGASSGNYYYYVSTLNATYGSELVQIPQGVQDIRVLWAQENTTDLISDTYLSNYNLLLQVELSDPIV